MRPPEKSTSRRSTPRVSKESLQRPRDSFDENFKTAIENFADTRHCICSLRQLGDAMNTLFTNTRSALYQATVVANARYRGDVLNLQAMGLTYSTLLSLVPFLAVMFSVLKAFGVQNGLEPFLAQL